MHLTIEKIIGHLAENSAFEEEVSEETLLFSSGALDSIAMITLITFVEQESGVEVRADEVTLENFDTPSRIYRFVLEKAA